MSTEVEKKEKKEKKGRLSWLIPVIEIITMIAYFAIGYKGIMKGFKDFDLEGMFKGVETAIIFLLVVTAITTVLCFIPLFKSKGNKSWAWWNIIWIISTVYGLM